MNYLEGQSGPDFIRQNLSDNLVKGAEDLHCQLGLNSAFVNQIIESISQGQTKARGSLSQLCSFKLASDGVLPAATIELIVSN